MDILYENLLKFSWQNGGMILIGALLIFLAIKKEMEPSLLMHSIGVNVSGQIASVIAGGIILTTMLINKIFSGKKD